MTVAPLLEVARGNIVESVHYGSIAVVDASGKLISSYGDPQTVAFLCSSAKPFQVLRQFGALSSKQEQALAAFGPVKPVKNHRGILTGQSRPVFKL
jgi:L-asparaginase II